MFPESHSHAFAVPAYQVAWLKRCHPLEFFVALMNNQPMVFYPMETLKQDARRFDVPVLNPCVNRSRAKCAPETGDVQLILWPSVFARRRGELGSQVVEVRGHVSRRDGTTSVIATDVRAVRSGVAMPSSHDQR